MEIVTKRAQSHGFPNQIVVKEGEVEAWYFVDASGLQFSLAIKEGMENKINPFPDLINNPIIKWMIVDKRRELDEYVGV